MVSFLPSLAEGSHCVASIKTCLEGTWDLRAMEGRGPSEAAQSSAGCDALQVGGTAVRLSLSSAALIFVIQVLGLYH